MKLSRRTRPMNLFTKRVLTKKYDLIQSRYWQRNKFESLQDFLAEFEGVEALPYEANVIEHIVCLYDPDGDFAPGNVRFVNVENELDETDIYDPAV